MCNVMAWFDGIIGTWDTVVEVCTTGHIEFCMNVVVSECERTEDNLASKGPLEVSKCQVRFNKIERKDEGLAEVCSEFWGGRCRMTSK